MKSVLITIDGGQGEGGGQVLRTALTLSLITGTPVELVNIRAGRKKPGLLRQHLTCVQAAQTISNGRCEGAELGSQRICFWPGKVIAGDYQFAIGSAGSTVLVCQTILLPLALAQGKSRVKFIGGTHNGLSPSLTFFMQSYLPILAQMGIVADVDVDQYGFNPAGGGHWTLNIQSSEKLTPILLLDGVANRAQTADNCGIEVLNAALPQAIAVREVNASQQYLAWQHIEPVIKQVPSVCAGNSLHLSVQCQHYRLMAEQVAQLGVKAESLAKRTAGRLVRVIKADVAVDEYLADQLLLPIALAGSGSFTTIEPSLHTKTNIAVIEQLIGQHFEMRELGEQNWRITLQANA